MGALRRSRVGEEEVRAYLKTKGRRPDSHDSSTKHSSPHFSKGARRRIYSRSAPFPPWQGSEELWAPAGSKFKAVRLGGCAQCRLTCFLTM